MKKLLFSLVALFIASMAVAANPSHVRVNPRSGDPVLFRFSDKPEISMLADGIKITANGENPVSFQFDEILNIDFPASSEVADIEKTSINVTAFPDRVVFSNIPAGTPFKLFSINGQLVYSADNQPEVTIYKADYPRGIYIAAIGNTSFKVIL